MKQGTPVEIPGHQACILFYWGLVGSENTEEVSELTTSFPNLFSSFGFAPP
jgi:hypothetical protein